MTEPQYAAVVRGWEAARDRAESLLYSLNREAVREAREQERQAWHRMISADVWRREGER